MFLNTLMMPKKLFKCDGHTLSLKTHTLYGHSGVDISSIKDCCYIKYNDNDKISCTHVNNSSWFVCHEHLYEKICKILP